MRGIWDMCVHSSVGICVFGYDVVLCINVCMVCWCLCVYICVHFWLFYHDILSLFDAFCVILHHFVPF